jgi:hypothetical protein
MASDQDICPDCLRYFCSCDYDAWSDLHDDAGIPLPGSDRPA